MPSSRLNPVLIARLLGAGLWLAAAGAGAQEPQSAVKRPVLGNERTPFLRYDSSVAPTNLPPPAPGQKPKPYGPVTNVAVAGTWSSWTGRYPLTQIGENLWELDTRTLGARLGRQEFKFIVNSEWEPGANRVLPLILDGVI